MGRVAPTFVLKYQHKGTFLADKGAIEHVLVTQGYPIRSD